MKKVLIPAALAIASLSACSQVFTGADLLERLSAKPPSQVAVGYIAGVVDAIEGILFCAPEGITVGQTAGLIYSVLESSPQARNLPAAAVIAAVLSRQWPCERRQQRDGQDSEASRRF